MVKYLNSQIMAQSNIKMELDIQVKNLAVEMERLLLLNTTVRSELRRNGGHNGKVNAKLLDWLDHVDRIEKQFSNIWYSYLSLVGLVKFIQIGPSSVLVFFASSEVFEEYRFSGRVSSFFPRDFNKYRFSRAAAFPLVEKIKDKIWEYLDDPLIRTVSFYGGEWIKHKITRQIKIGSFVHKIVNLSENTNLKNWQHYMRKNEGAEAYKCVVIFGYESTWKPELLDNIDTQILNMGNIYSYNSVSMINKQILNLTNEVKVLVGSNASLQLLHDDNGAHAVAGRFSMRQTLTGQLTREISSNILEYLLDPTIGTIGLYGVGGVGKTTIVKNICNELSNTDTFDIIIWVSLSKTKLNDDYTEDRKRWQDEIAMQLGLKLLGYENPEERASRISEKLMIVGKCLFILDDLWYTVWLDHLGIPYPKRDNGCKIILTTRIRDVCTTMKVQKMIYLAPLSENEAWDLFVIKSGDKVFDPQIEGIARQIVYECGGLPITITTVCHAMKDKVDITVWRLALKEMQSKNSQIYGEEDYKFDSAELIRYWLAENLMHTNGGIVESLNNGLEILKELKDASMLETFMEGGIEWIKMHDLFRDIAIIILKVELDFLVKTGACIHEFPFTQKGKISLIRNSIVNLPDTYFYNQLSTLLMRDSPLDHIPHSFFLSMPNLRVLDMSHSGFNQLPPSLSELCKLRVLFLDFCTGLEKFPSLEKLKDLRFLSLRGTLIKELPQGIAGLANLISLNLSETIRLKHIKADVISSLSNLEELQLQGSHLCKMESLEVANLFKEISCLKQLGILRLSAIGFGDPLDTILHLQQHNLKIFSVTAYGSTLDYMEDE